MFLVVLLLCMMEWVLQLTGANTFGGILVWICILYALQSIYMSMGHEFAEESVTENLVCLCTVLLSIVLNSVTNNNVEDVIRNVQVLEKCVSEISKVQAEILVEYTYNALCAANRIVQIVLTV